MINDHWTLIIDHSSAVGARGFEPPTSWSRTRRANRTALRPEIGIFPLPGKEARSRRNRMKGDWFARPRDRRGGRARGPRPRPPRGRAPRVVYASSAAVYGPPERLPVPETHPTRPISDYGSSKLALEHYLNAYQARGLIEYAALRFANVYGPRQRSDGEGGVVAIFSDRMLAGKPVTIFGDGTKTRDYIYVGDVVDATIRAASGPTGVVANLGWGRQVSDLELFREVAAATKYSREPTFAPDRPGDIAHSCLDPALARQTWDWKPAVALRDGVRRVVEWSAR